MQAPFMQFRAPFCFVVVVANSHDITRYNEACNKKWGEQLLSNNLLSVVLSSKVVGNGSMAPAN
jgi:hypothetical protein